MAKRTVKIKTKFDQKNEVRAIARERVGPVKASRTIVPKTDRRKPKHKKASEDEINL